MKQIYTLGKVIDILNSKFVDASMDKNVKKLMAEALYQTWLIVAADEKERDDENFETLPEVRE